ncbi:MAG: gliding motility lipoprotein GldD [Bacteroidetes bacterium]|nr:MAG: gliding motility lipoprotein GldD [Bacteroidota bacterium]
MKNLLLLLVIVLCISCGSDPVPKPKAFLRLDYPKPQYIEVNNNLPFTFEKNSLANNIGKIKTSANQKTLGVEITYPTIKGTIYLTYKKIDSASLQRYIVDAQNITQTHATRADAITKQPFINFENRVYGMLYEVDGNAASQSQFYVTDSINHFLTGALYFYVKPNYDSILPAANYIRNDIQHIMETLKWKQ